MIQKWRKDQWVEHARAKNENWLKHIKQRGTPKKWKPTETKQRGTTRGVGIGHPKWPKTIKKDNCLIFKHGHTNIFSILLFYYIGYRLITVTFPFFSVIYTKKLILKIQFVRVLTEEQMIWHGNPPMHYSGQSRKRWVCWYEKLMNCHYRCSNSHY